MHIFTIFFLFFWTRLNGACKKNVNCKSTTEPFESARNVISGDRKERNEHARDLLLPSIALWVHFNRIGGQFNILKYTWIYCQATYRFNLNKRGSHSHGFRLHLQYIYFSFFPFHVFLFPFCFLHCCFLFHWIFFYPIHNINYVFVCATVWAR